MASTSFRNGEFYNSVGLQASDETSSLEGTSIKIQRQASSFAVKDVKKLEMPPINSESKTPIHSSNEVDNDEKGLLKKIDDAWQRKDLQGMFQLIEENYFSETAQRKVLCYWDMGHYFQESERRRKPLTPLARFRIRERFLPPRHICPNGRKKATLPKEATNVLREWLENSTRPYPTREIKNSLAERTGLSVMQVNTWFANTRRRMRGGRKKQGKEMLKTCYPLEENPLPLINSQLWPTTYFSSTMTSSQSVFPPCSGVCACAAQLPQFLAPLQLETRSPWQEMNPNMTTFTEWPPSQSAAVGNQYFSPSMVPLAGSLWEPERQHCGLHAAAQILMDMASK